ncbi:MAG: nuclear transport factor 2 family protein, partial [Ktedonobacterales bacterium]
MSTSQAPSAKAEQQLKQLAEQWAAAEQSADTAAIERTLADDFVGIGPLGFLLSKQEWLQRHQSGALQYTSFTLDDTQVRVYGDAAVMIGRITQAATY